MSNYWTGRHGLAYYRVAVDFVRRYAPDARRLLDVGGGVSRGCQYLQWLPQLQRTSVELPDSGSQQLHPVRVVKADFLDWDVDGPYDVVMCLQVLEHVPQVEAFTVKLFDCAPTVVISVPYRWPAGRTACHVHDPVDEAKLHGWTKRQPLESRIIGQSTQRLVCVYQDSRFVHGTN